MNFKNIIWDWNGTLLDDVKVCVEAINPILEKRNLSQIDVDYYRKIFDFPVRNYYEQLGFDFSKEDFVIPALEFMRLYKEKVIKCTLHQGMKQILVHLHQSGYRQFVLSAMEDNYLKEMIHQFDLDAYFQSVYGIQDDFAHSKKETGKLLMKTEGLIPAETLIVGDTLHDLECSRELGVQAWLLSHGHQSYERLSGSGNQTFSSYKGLGEKLGIKIEVRA